MLVYISTIKRLRSDFHLFLIQCYSTFSKLMYFEKGQIWYDLIIEWNCVLNF